MAGSQNVHDPQLDFMQPVTTLRPVSQVLEGQSGKETGSARVPTFSSADYAVNTYLQAWVSLQVVATVLWVAFTCYGSVAKAWQAARGIQAKMRKGFGQPQRRRIARVDGKYYLGMYMPSFPSAAYRAHIRTELNKVIPHQHQVNRLQAIQLAITSKCPLRCEHCFEWHNLNLVDPFSPEDLKQLIHAFQEEGCTQLYFTGGEPMVRMRRLEELIRYASPRSECWVLTSGQNLTRDNAMRLKAAGCTGVSISLDHFDSDAHNFFRGSDDAFEAAIRAIRHANEAKLVTAFSICLTRSFVNEENLNRYMALAKNCGAVYVQMLEPKAVGHYEGKEVFLTKPQTDLLDDFYLRINYDPQYRDYPLIIYHGYHQRQMGCISGGNWSLYIDSAGFINACTFCHSHQYHAKDILSGALRVDQLQMGGCPSRVTVA